MIDITMGWNENLRPAQGNIAIGMTALKSLREGPNNTVVELSFISLSEGDSNVAIGMEFFQIYPMEVECICWK